MAAAPRLATFECDATPPPGHPACGGWIRPLESVEAPLLLKGVILDDGSVRLRQGYGGQVRAVLAALDWCRLQGGAYDLFRRRIAEAAGVDPDVAGEFRARFEKEEGLPHLYFAGCGGDLAVGKYSDAPPAELRALLVERLRAAARQAIAFTHVAPAERLVWASVQATFAPRTEPEFGEEHLRRVLADPGRPAVERLKAALGMAWYERLRERPAVDFGGLRIGPVLILNLPGEALVEYQLYAQSLRPDAFVAVAANGEGGPGYICTDRAIADLVGQLDPSGNPR